MVRGGPAATSRCDPPRAPGRPLPVPAGGAVRRGPRPDRIRRRDRHDARPPRRVRDLLQLRRGRPPLGARADRHAGGAAQARQAVRTDRERGTLRAPAVQARGALRSRSDAGNDVQAAQRLRARRPRPALTLARRGEGYERRRRARRRGRAGVQRSDRPQRQASEARDERRARDCAGLGQPRPRLSDGREAQAQRRGDPGAPPQPDRSAQLSPSHRIPADALVQARPDRRRLWRHALPGDRPDRGTGPARALLSQCRRHTCGAPTDSRMSPTSWSTASTTPTSNRAAHSRS